MVHFTAISEGAQLCEMATGGVQYDCVQLRDIWEQLSKPHSLYALAEWLSRDAFLHFSLTWMGAEGNGHDLK